MASKNDSAFKGLDDVLELDKSIQMFVRDFVEKEKAKESGKQREGFIPVQAYDYIEAYDTGIIFDSLTDVARIKSFRKNFYSTLKETINLVLSSQTFREKAPNLRANVLINDDREDFISIRIYCDNMFITFPEIILNKSGMAFAKFDFLNAYTALCSFTPYSIYSKGKSSPYANIDDLPLTVKMLERTIEEYSAHCHYDEGIKNLTVEKSKLYGGLNENNIISKYVHYLIDKFGEYNAQDKPDDFEVFPKETEEKLNKYVDWFQYGLDRQRFSNITDDGFVEEKRPAEFIRDLQDVINRKSLLVNVGNANDIMENEKTFIKEALEILYGLLADKADILSVEQSFEDYMSIVDTYGSDPLEKIARVLEGYFDLPSSFASGLDVARAIYCCMDKAKEQLQKKNKRFYLRKSTNKKGRAIEDFALLVHEEIQDGQVSFRKRLEIIDKGMEEDSFSLLRVADNIKEKLAVIETEPHTQTVTRDGNIYVHECEKFKYRDWTEEFYNAYKLACFFRAVDNSFDDLGFDITELVKTEVALKNIMAEYSDFISTHPKDEVGINLALEYDSIYRRLELKKRLKEEEISNRKSKYDMIFNFAFAVFGAFGVASSIVSILLSDTTSKAISIGSIMLYLLIVGISYKNSRK